LEINARASTNINDHQLCFFVVRAGSDKCPYTTNCKHSHDLTTYLSRRPDDLQSYCYMFETYGQCFFGMLCRYGRLHVDPLTGDNRLLTSNRAVYLESFNKYPPQLKHLLRRKKYNYALSDCLVRLANREITKVNVLKRNNTNETTDDKQDEQIDRSLVDIYYQALTTIDDQSKVSKSCTIRSKSINVREQ
jgi:hypothetical protein